MGRGGEPYPPGRDVTKTGNSIDLALFAVLGFGKLILWPAQTVGKYAPEQTIEAINQRLELFAKGDLGALWNDAVR